MKSEKTATARKAEIEQIVAESVRCGEFSLCSQPTNHSNVLHVTAVDHSGGQDTEENGKPVR